MISGQPEHGLKRWRVAGKRELQEESSVIRRWGLHHQNLEFLQVCHQYRVDGDILVEIFGLILILPFN